MTGDTQARRFGHTIATPEEITARLLRLETLVDEHDDALRGHPADQPGDPGSPPVDLPASAEPAYLDVTAWVTDHFTQVYPRALGGEWRWCPRWYHHPEALSRLEALWRAWKTLRTDPGLGMAIWYRDHLDPQLSVLLGNRGPFAQCTATRHETVTPLATTTEPEDATPA